jgi:hypothetical protein
VLEKVEVEPAEEGGVGWACLFCAQSIGASPLLLAVKWTEDGVQREQWFASHRDCLVDRIADDEALRGGPLFGG